MRTKDNKKNIMILGAGRGQLDLIRAVGKYGYNPVVTSIEGDYPGLRMGYDVCNANLLDPDEVLEAAREWNVAGITTACMDLGIPALGYACDKLGLHGISAKAAYISGNKDAMKEAFVKGAVNTAAAVEAKNEEDVKDAINKIGFPLIVKAIDLQGSAGITIARTEEEALKGYRHAMSMTRKEKCLIEKLLEGHEFGAQAFVANGKILYILPCGDITYKSNTFIPIGHFAPLDLSADVMSQVYEQAEKAIHAVGLNDCAVNIDFILSNNKVYVIELTGRVGANCLPQLTSIYYGLDIYKMIIDASVGIDPKPYFEKNQKTPTPCYALMLFSDREGKLQRIENDNSRDPDIEEITFFVKPNDVIKEFTNSKDCLGQVVIKGKSVDSCRKKIEAIRSNIRFVLE